MGIVLTIVAAILLGAAFGCVVATTKPFPPECEPEADGLNVEA